MKRLVLTAAVLILALSVTGCGSAVGTIEGTITGSNDVPLADVQIILCETAAEDADEYLVCTLKGAPTTTTDSDGAFTLADVPAGNYVVMYGLPGQLTLSADEWDGIPVTRGNFCMDGGQNSVCEIEGVEPSPFWSEGAMRLGEEILAFTYQDYEDQPGVIILATAEEGSAAEFMHIFLGTVQSNYAGITANISAGQYAPSAEVVGDEVTTVTIEVPLQ